jgi:hypothetical protein
MADRIGSLADPSTYDDPYADAPGVGLGTAPQGNVAGSLAAVAGDLGQRVADWYQRQPSWTDQMGAAQSEMDRTGDPTALLHALGGFTGSTTPRAGLSVKPIGALADVSAYQPIKAYHSSPYDFDRFDMSKIGTGEGAQSYGHGLYFAENPAVSGQGGQYWSQFKGRFGGDEAQAMNRLWASNFDRDAAIQTTQRKLDQLAEARQSGVLPSGVVGNYTDPVLIDSITRSMQRSLQAQHDLLTSGKPVGPRTYEVNINADPATMLNWDAPLAEQPQAVQDLADRLKVTPWRQQDPVLGSEVYRAGQRASSFGHYGVPPPSEALLQAGIPGIKYLDQGSRGSGVGTHNYVMFNDKLIDIMRKYGIPGIAGAGAAAQYGQQPQQQP